MGLRCTGNKDNTSKKRIKRETKEERRKKYRSGEGEECRTRGDASLGLTKKAERKCDGEGSFPKVVLQRTRTGHDQGRTALWLTWVRMVRPCSVLSVAQGWTLGKLWVLTKAARRDAAAASVAAAVAVPVVLLIRARKCLRQKLVHWSHLCDSPKGRRACVLQCVVILLLACLVSTYRVL